MEGRKYKVNPSTLTLEHVKMSKKEYLKKASYYLLGGMFFTIIVLFVNYALFDSPKELLLKKRLEKYKNVELMGISDIQQSLETISNYLESKKEAIIIEERVLQKLKNEKSKLEPIIKAERKAVRAIFEEQRKQNRYQSWLNLGASFILGIIASIIGNYIYKATKNTGINIKDVDNPTIKE